MPVVPFLTPVLGEGSLTKIDESEKVGYQLILTFMEDLGLFTFFCFNHSTGGPSRAYPNEAPDLPGPGPVDVCGAGRAPDHCPAERAEGPDPSARGMGTWACERPK